MKKIPIILLVLIFNHFGVKSQVVINEVYGGGGNSGSVYKNDFIELFNTGSVAVNLSGWSVQYASKTGATWAVTRLTGSIPARGYYLIREISGNGGTMDLPGPDDSGTIAISTNSGKIALVHSTTPLSGTCPTAATDEVGFGASANCFEGAGPAPAPSNLHSIQRTPLGNDTQNNSTDFIAGTPSPKNSAMDDQPPVVVALFPANNASNISTTFSANITFSERVARGSSGSISLIRVSDDSLIQNISVLDTSIAISGMSASFPVRSVNPGTSYYIEITPGAIKDSAGNDFKGITGHDMWSFTTGTGIPPGTIGLTYNFNDCTSFPTSGFTNFSINGTNVWGCTTFGRDPANPGGTTAFEKAVQINGFSNGANALNTDWLISPPFDLTTTPFPLLSFWSRTAFNGPSLQLKVSTDYPGTGDPSGFTWTDLNGRFPPQASNTWTLSQNINLASFRSAHTYFAFVYQSTTEAGARWTLDDVRIDSSDVAPQASLNTSATNIEFGYAPVSAPAIKNFTFTGNDLTGNVTLTTTGTFLISKTTGNFSRSITYTQAEANNIPQTVFVEFLPAKNGLSYSGAATISTAGVPGIPVNLSGNSIDSVLTLEVVNWNLEWFGSLDSTLGPRDKPQQEFNVKKITAQIGADIFGFVEVVSETELQNVVANLNSVFGAGTYNYVICNYGSHANPFEANPSPVSAVQKEAFVYKTSVISPVEAPGPLITNAVNTSADLANPAYNYFSSGRYPYMMNAKVTLGGISKQVRFVLLHAKANTSPINTAYKRRKSGADTLNFTLNRLFPSDNIVLLGDFNDDLDQTITAGFTQSSYSTFNADSTHFFSPTLALSLAGKKSTVGFNDMIDHVELSNEMRPYYLQNSASVLSDVTALVPNYGSTTSDHFPILTRYAFDPSIVPISLLPFTITKKNNTATLQWSASQDVKSKTFIVQRSVDGKKWVAAGQIKTAGKNSSRREFFLTDHKPMKGINYYRLKQVDISGKVYYSKIKTARFGKHPRLSARFPLKTQ